MQEVLVNRLGGLSLPRKSVVRLTDRPDMTLDVYRGCKTTMQQQQQPIGQHFFTNRVVHLPKSIETVLIIEASLITELDQAVRAVHSCNSWF